MNVKEKIGQRIKDERTAKGLTRKALAALTDNLNVSRINNYERGDRTPGPEEIKQLAEALEVSPAFLMCLSDDRQGKLNQKVGLGALLPVLDYQQAANPQAYIEQIKSESHPDKLCLTPISPELAKKISASSFAMKIKDESMSPEFRAGDIVIIDPESKPIPGDYVVYLMAKDEEVVLRKYKQLSASRDTAHFELIALNKDWADVTVNNGNQGCLIGTAMNLNRDLK